MHLTSTCQTDALGILYRLALVIGLGRSCADSVCESVPLSNLIYVDLWSRKLADTIGRTAPMGLTAGLTAAVEAAVWDLEGGCWVE